MFSACGRHFTLPSLPFRSCHNLSTPNNQPSQMREINHLRRLRPSFYIPPVLMAPFSQAALSGPPPWIVPLQKSTTIQNRPFTPQYWVQALWLCASTCKKIYPVPGGPTRSQADHKRTTSGSTSAVWSSSSSLSWPPARSLGTRAFFSMSKNSSLAFHVKIANPKFWRLPPLPTVTDGPNNTPNPSLCQFISNFGSVLI